MFELDKIDYGLACLLLVLCFIKFIPSIFDETKIFWLRVFDTIAAIGAAISAISFALAIVK